MLTGRRFKLTTPAIALDSVNGKRVAITIPEGTIVKVVSGPVGTDRILDVLWEGRIVDMFALDVREYGVEITD